MDRGRGLKIRIFSFFYEWPLSYRKFDFRNGKLSPRKPKKYLNNGSLQRNGLASYINKYVIKKFFFRFRTTQREGGRRNVHIMQLCLLFVLFSYYTAEIYIAFMKKAIQLEKKLWGKKKSRGLFFAIAENLFSTDLWALGTQQKFDLRVFWANFFIIWKPNGFLTVVQPNWWIFHSEKLHRVQPRRKLIN